MEDKEWLDSMNLFAEIIDNPRQVNELEIYMLNQLKTEDVGIVNLDRIKSLKYNPYALFFKSTTDLTDFDSNFKELQKMKSDRYTKIALWQDQQAEILQTIREKIETNFAELSSGDFRFLIELTETFKNLNDAAVNGLLALEEKHRLERQVTKQMMLKEEFVRIEKILLEEVAKVDD